MFLIIHAVEEAMCDVGAPRSFAQGSAPETSSFHLIKCLINGTFQGHEFTVKYLHVIGRNFE